MFVLPTTSKATHNGKKPINDCIMNLKSNDIAESAAELFDKGFCCSESVLQAVAQSRGVQSDLVPRIATGFCGGIARTGNVCGALAGAVMALSLFTGRNRPTDPRDENCKLIQQVIRQFEARFGTVLCRDLIGCRLDTPEGHRYFVENNLRAKCVVFTREAARMAAEVLMSASPPPAPGISRE